MQSTHQQLDPDQRQHRGGHREERLERHPERAAHEQHPEPRRQGQPGERADPAPDPDAVESAGGEEHEREQEHAAGRAAARVGGARQAGLDLLLHARRGAPHPPHQREHQDRADQHRDPLEQVLVPGQPRGERGGDARERDRHAGPGEQRALEPSQAAALEHGQGDRQHQGGLDAFAQRDDQGFEHDQRSRPPGSAGRRRVPTQAWQIRGEQSPKAASLRA